MRILHTSDWHLGKTLENISRMEEQRQFADELCGIAEKEEADLVLVAGDVFDTYTPSAAAEALFYDIVNRLSSHGKRAVIVIAGNHDSPERLCAASPLAYRNGIILLGYPGSDAGVSGCGEGRTQIVDSGPGWLELHIEGCEHNAVVIALPYPSEARLEQALPPAEDESGLQRAYSEKVSGIFRGLNGKFRDDTVNLAVSHIFILGGKESDSERTLQVGGAMTVDPGALPCKAHFTALGHLHRPQALKGAPCPAVYSGSPLAYSFSEAGYSKAVYIVEAVPGKDADVREVFLSCGKPLKRWIARNGIEEALQWCEEGRDSGAWIDLEIHTDRVFTAEEQRKLRELNPGIINIRPLILEDEAEAAGCEDRENRKTDELFRDYYRYRTGVEVSDELMGTFLELLDPVDEEEILPADDAETIA